MLPSPRKHWFFQGRAATPFLIPSMALRTDDNIRAGLYARVSTEDRGQDPETQLRPLREYAERRGFIVVGEFVDHASGTTETRPRYQRLLEAARKRELDVVLVWRYDRFARSTRALVNALGEFKARGVAFISYQENVDTTTPQGELVFGMMANLAQFESALIGERVKAGMARAKAQGGRPSHLSLAQSPSRPRLAHRPKQHLERAPQFRIGTQLRKAASSLEQSHAGERRRDFGAQPRTAVSLDTFQQRAGVDAALLEELRHAALAQQALDKLAQALVPAVELTRCDRVVAAAENRCREQVFACERQAAQAVPRGDHPDGVEASKVRPRRRLEHAGFDLGE